MIHDEMYSIKGNKCKAVFNVDNTCSGCVYRIGGHNGNYMCPVIDYVKCFPENRSDNTNVIYKRHHTPTNAQLAEYVINLK